MGKLTLLTMLLVLLCGCNSVNTAIVDQNKSDEFIVAFGSCNKHNTQNDLWDDVLAIDPDVWVWGGDIIYADTDDNKAMARMYKAQNRVKDYKKLRQHAQIVGTWDDHDYGVNDGGVEFHAKKNSQVALLDFLGVSKDSPRRQQEGVYAAHEYQLSSGKVKLIVLDTRYFRTALTPDTLTNKRNTPNAYGEGTILGDKQWNWLAAQLNDTTADFNLIVSSVQFLSDQHGFECWGNFPHEVARLKQLIVNAKAKGVMVLSGDRHISEFSKTELEGLPYPLVDFTSSGLTHAYSDFKGEDNPYRYGQVVFQKSFGVIRINLASKKVDFKMMGNNGKVLEQLQQSYEDLPIR